MNARSVALRDELLALPLDERAEFAAELLASLDDEDSLDDPVEVDLAWRDELSRRSEQIATGTVATVGWDQVLERVADSRRTLLPHRLISVDFPGRAVWADES